MQKKGHRQHSQTLYDEMHEKLRRDPNYTRFLTKRRSSRVEPVVGTLINHHNMKRINSRGMVQANKTCFNGCAYIQSEEIPEIHHPKSSPQCLNHEPSKREVLVLAKPLAHGFHTFSIANINSKESVLRKSKTSLKSL